MRSAAILRTLPAVRDVEFAGLQVKAMEILGAGIAIKMPESRVRYFGPEEESRFDEIVPIGYLACDGCRRPPLMFPVLGQVISFPWTMPQEWVAWGGILAQVTDMGRASKWEIRGLHVLCGICRKQQAAWYAETFRTVEALREGVVPDRPESARSGAALYSEPDVTCGVDQGAIMSATRRGFLGFLAAMVAAPKVLASVAAPDGASDYVTHAPWEIVPSDEPQFLVGRKVVPAVAASPIMQGDMLVWETGYLYGEAGRGPVAPPDGAPLGTVRPADAEDDHVFLAGIATACATKGARVDVLISGATMIRAESR